MTRPPDSLKRIAALKRIVLIGFSATGKSAVAPALAASLGWRALDLDVLIEERDGRSVPDIFAQDGEHAFRAIEREAVRAGAAEAGVVIAAGGGAWLDAESRGLLADGGFVVALEARLDTILARHTGAELGRPDARPLLAGADSVARVQLLKARRQPFYALADATVHTDETAVGAVVEEIRQALDRNAARALASRSRLHGMVEGPGVASTAPPDFGADVACTVDVGGDGSVAAYPVYCRWGLLARLPALLDAVGLRGRVFVISDETVRGLYAEPVVAGLRESGRSASLRAVPPGETSKSLEQLERLYAWLAEERAERDDTVLALGGGVVTDLAGTVAATYLRGMPLVHVPTTLLGMVDAAIGGKVAVDLPAGKNLVGAFYQPRAVVADVATLATLPSRELRAGYAEVIKHAFIRDAAMLDELERDAETLLAINDAGADAARERAVALIARNMAIKAAVVSVDEREGDLRMILNYGHTIGHAIEAVTGYGRFRHGEAVAIGLMGAARIAERVGLIDSAIVERHRRILQRFGLPIAMPDGDAVPVDALLEAILSDKKVVEGQSRWVLLESVGSPVVREDVPEAVVREVLGELVGAPARA